MGAADAATAVARIALVKPDKARGIEDMLLTAARRGQIGEKVRCRPPPAALAAVRLHDETGRRAAAA
eukprot:scaffold2737_cov218-Prasinococcus_capsulatus_cf.AAC.4